MLPALKHYIDSPYWELMRINRPIGILLLLWPTWWALWLAAEGLPKLSIFIIFTLGVAVTRAAGCVINDIADKEVDKHVKRTQQRPLASGRLTVHQAKQSLIILCVIALILVSLTNLLTIFLAFIAAAIAFAYPFVKRVSHLPQVVLGVAFSMGIPMAFSAQTGKLEPLFILIFVTNLLWTVVYDTYYGMTDREYDKKIGVKSTAILFEGSEKIILGSLQVLTLLGFFLMGQRFGLGTLYYLSVLIAAGMMIYHQWLIGHKKPEYYFKAFIHNNWLGMTIFLGIALDYAFK